MPQDRTDLPIDETIDVTLRAVRIVDNTPLIVELGGEEVTVPAGGTGVVDIQVVAPANWPPQAGDVWTDAAGKPWFAKRDPTDADPQRVRMYVYDNSAGPAGTSQWRAASRPVKLVYRATVPG